MISPRWLLTVSLMALILCAYSSLFAADDSFKAPDSLLLKQGKVVHGLIIKNTWNSVLLQEEFGEKTYMKSDIIRIFDNANPDPTYTRLERKGELPAWRVIVNDLRTLDQIKSLVEIPATTVEKGVFTNVPYLSFRANDDIEMNIYGDPNDPAGFEIGIYGKRLGNSRLRQDIRAFLAGFLTTRQEIATLYALDLTGGIMDAGKITIEVTPPKGVDAYGAWWISLYNKKKLAQVRISKAAYLKVTRPENEVVDKHGRVISSNGWTTYQQEITHTFEKMGQSMNGLLRGFYRDKNGDFRLLTDPTPTPTPAHR